MFSVSPRRSPRSNRLASIRQAVEMLEPRQMLAATLFTADFEGVGGAASDDGFTYSTAPNLWHTSTIRAQSPTHAMYYGQDATRNYDTGVTNSGTITSPSISLVGRTAADLRFRYLLGIEFLAQEDVKVEITTNNGTSWTALATQATLQNNSAWTLWTGSLNAYVGSTIKLRFNFNTVDNISNNHEGWFVDDIIVSDPAGDPAPEVTAVSPSENSTISGTSATFQYTFSEAVSNVDVTDLVLSGTAAPTATVTGVTMINPTTASFTVSGLTAGILNALLAPDAGDITDSTGQSVRAVSTRYLVILPDRFEVNESFAAAADLGVIGATRSENNLTLHTASDQDYYKFTADASGSMTFNLAYDANVSDIDFVVYNSSQVAFTDATPNDGTITFNVTKGQTYYIKVSSLFWASPDYDMSFTGPAEGPRVSRVWVKGSAWNASYLSFLGANIANSSATYGYAIPTGTNQLQTLPWININTVSIQFSEPVNLTRDQLIMVGTSAYNVAGSTFTYNATDRVGTWRLPANFVADRLYVKLLGAGAGTVTDLAGTALDGEFTTSTSSFPSGNGAPGGDFVFRFDVLPGDSSGNGLVNSTDISQAKLRAAQPIDAVNYRTDMNASNAINSTDITIAKLNAATTLPPAPSLMVFSEFLLTSQPNLLS